MSSVNVCIESVEIVNKKWSQGSSCLPTCSRGLSPSSGDHDGSEKYSFCSEKCSCCSDYYLTEYCDRPCIIIDSETRLRKSKWQKFKSYLKRYIKFDKNKYCLDIMNLTPVQSGSKCSSSDFSIKRILSEDKIHREDSQAPGWLCCTRYQPPRLPRATNACRARRSGRHARVPFTGAQAAALEAAYSRSPYLAPPALRALAAALQLRDDRIKIWFQNRRARERRERTGTVNPPKPVVLPSTTQKSILPNEIWVPNQSQTHYNFNFIDTQENSAARTDQDTSLHDNKFAYSSISTSDEESNGSSLDIETIID